MKEKRKVRCQKQELTGRVLLMCTLSLLIWGGRWRGRVELTTATWGLAAVCPSSVSLREPGAKIYWLPGLCCVGGLVFTGLGQAEVSRPRLRGGGDLELG